MLNPKQEKCAELLASGEYKQKQIAQILEVTENTISNWKKNAEFNIAYEVALRENISMIAAKAFQTEVSLLRARSETVRLMAAKDILDRAGFKPTEKVEVLRPIDESVAELDALLKKMDDDGKRNVSKADKK